MRDRLCSLPLWWAGDCKAALGVVACMCVCLFVGGAADSPSGEDKRRFLKGYVPLSIGKNEWE